MEAPVKVWAPGIIQPKAKIEKVAAAIKPKRKRMRRMVRVCRASGSPGSAELPAGGASGSSDDAGAAPPRTKNSGTNATQPRNGTTCAKARKRQMPERAAPPKAVIRFI